MTAAKWQVVCDDYRCKPVSSQDQAERLLASIEAAGHCRLTHHVETAK